MSYTDIHFHALPGVDDGPATMEESVALLATAYAEGTRTIVATPHVRRDFLTAVEELPDRVREVRDRLLRHRIDVRLLCGGELGHEMVGRLGQRDFSLIAQGPPHGRWLLVETPFSGFDEEFSSATDELRDRGFAVVVAHPERAADPDGSRWRAIRHELAHGSALQVNAWSLAGNHGLEAQAVARRLVRERRAEVVGSDAHGARRPPALLLGRDAAALADLDGRAADQLIRSNPRRLLERGLRARRYVEAPAGR